MVRRGGLDSLLLATVYHLRSSRYAVFILQRRTEPPPPRRIAIRRPIAQPGIPGGPVSTFVGTTHLPPETTWPAEQVATTVTAAGVDELALDVGTVAVGLVSEGFGDVGVSVALGVSVAVGVVVTVGVVVAVGVSVALGVSVAVGVVVTVGVVVAVGVGVTVGGPTGAGHWSMPGSGLSLAVLATITTDRPWASLKD